jgi:DNA-binding XRE family transcriptional regulator
VCPCCNRSFENLRQHMATQHADFGQERTLKALREAFGMTQADVAEEAGTRMPYVSLFERGKPVPAEARESLTWWLERQGAK